MSRRSANARHARSASESPCRLVIGRSRATATQSAAVSGSIDKARRDPSARRSSAAAASGSFPASASLDRTSAQLTTLTAAPSPIASMTTDAPSSAWRTAIKAEACQGPTPDCFQPLRRRRTADSPLSAAASARRSAINSSTKLRSGATSAKSPRIRSAAARRRSTSDLVSLVTWAMPGWYRPTKTQPSSLRNSRRTGTQEAWLAGARASLSANNVPIHAAYHAPTAHPPQTASGPSGHRRSWDSRYLRLGIRCWKPHSRHGGNGATCLSSRRASTVATSRSTGPLEQSRPSVRSLFQAASSLGRRR